MDEQNTKPESTFVNTATQKTVRIKPMVKQPVVNIGQPTKVSSVTTNSQPLSASVIDAKNVASNTTRPAPLPATATMPVKKVSLGRPGTSVLNSLDLKPKAAEAPAKAAATPMEEATNTTVVSKAKVAASVSAAFKDTISSSVAPTQKFVPVGKQDTSTGKVVKVESAAPAATDDVEADERTVKLQRPERKVATVGNTVVPALTPKAAAPAPAAETPAATPAEENTATVAVNKLEAPVAKSKIDLTPKAPAAPPVEAAPVEAAPAAAPVVEENTATVAVDKIEAAPAPKLNLSAKTDSVLPSQAPTVKLSLGKKAETPAPAPATEASKENAEVAKPKIGISKKEEPAAPVAPEAAKEDSLKESEKKVKEPQVKILKKDTVNPTKSKAYMAIMLIVFLFILFGAVLSVLQYLNTFEQERIMKGKVIEIPFIDNFVQK